MPKVNNRRLPQDYLINSDNDIVDFIRYLRHLLLPTEESVRITILFRLSSYYFCRNNKRLAYYYQNRLLKKHHVCISYRAKIGRNFILPHPVGIVIGENTVIGNNVTIYQNVTLGRKNSSSPKYPIVGDGAVIYAGAVIAGDLHLGENCVIGANSVVTASVEANSTYAGAPAKRVK